MMYENRGSGTSSFVVLLLIGFGLVAGFIFSQYGKLAEQKIESDRVLSEQADRLATLEPLAAAAAEEQARLTKERDAALAAQKKLEGDLAALRTAAGKAQDEQAKLISEQKAEIERLKGELAAKGGPQIPITSGTSTQPSVKPTVQPVVGAVTRERTNMLDTAFTLLPWVLGLAVIGLVAAAVVGFSFRRINPQETVSVKMSREDARRYGRSQGRKTS